jgi:hypothetical protein
MSSCDVLKPCAPACDGGAQQLLHRADLVRGGSTSRGVIPHDIAAQRRMADVGRRVDADAAFEPVQKIPERAASEWHALP